MERTITAMIDALEAKLRGLLDEGSGSEECPFMVAYDLSFVLTWMKIMAMHQELPRLHLWPRPSVAGAFVVASTLQALSKDLNPID